MATVRKTITVTEQQNEWIKAQIENGGFTNDSEYVRDLLRRDQERRTEFLELQAELQKGLDSGVSKRTVPEIMKDVEEKMRADGRL